MLSEVLGVLVALAAIPLLLRVGLGRGGGRTIRIRMGEPLRYRFPCLWLSLWGLGLMGAGVLWLASSCGWTS
ncbi:hypothetical protein [Actinomadura sp. WAC 06369]|uniref:hypothetical protein n=1 Tax=Actinomadura sp. WAC 06369 TaxID=2203193 RepID=UPI000F7A405B|nr:hypothetical protein [Actinomadura sp. WAC 06369]